MNEIEAKGVSIMWDNIVFLSVGCYRRRRKHLSH